MATKAKFQAIKGTRDLLPPETALWNRVEQTAYEVFGTFGYGEIRLPIFESTELFARAVGGETDIIGKEMYSFLDPPELTARQIANFTRELGIEETKRLAANPPELVRRLYEYQERAPAKANESTGSHLLDF